ncbi:down syndrome cell adhesion molecule-like protein Dscam2 [Caerostris darwini]|uniref:Down syndrome cell adhesion molecule-like protein Dscam2 n=1 Tax=Caerostris darwini TaxID=1538125 RepID=A0AAV4V6E2_9ARAC|nr:down syndrome cell adhesion molecule-like protein Dscam2 [Caerostris darwini]
MRIFRYPTTSASLPFPCKQGVHRRMVVKEGWGGEEIIWKRMPKAKGLPSSHEGQRGPTFFSEPPSRVEFQNDTGIIIPCSAQGHPAPMIAWTQQDGNPLRDVVGVRHTRPDGSLVFPPFAAEDFRQGVHDAVYRCVASNIVGSIISREVHVKAENVSQIRNLYCVAW